MHSFVNAHNTGIVISELNAEVLADAIISLNSDYYQKWNGCVNSKYLLDWHLVFNVWLEALDVQKRSQSR